jgi:diguanylate cyclase (GGDEF)-like protein
MTAASNIDDKKLLRLLCELQTSLDAETLIGIFYKHLRPLTGAEGVQYLNTSAGIEATHGQAGEHRLDLTLALSSEPLGTLSVFSTEALSARQKKSAEELLAHLLHPLRNALAHREAVNASARDPLTGVNNRSSFRKVLDREVDLSRRHGAPLSLIMIDVDRFKSINDMHGHLVGDMTLKSIAECMLKCTRDSDILFRYGGEEFCIALANTSLAGARKLAERVRRALEILVVRAYGARLHVTASFGVATLEADDDAAHLVERADHSLYRAKELGRNRIATQEDSNKLPATDR